jgi:signal transduction histidine kinase
MTEARQDSLPWLDDASRTEIRRAVEALYRVHGLMGSLTDLDALLVRISEESRRVAGAEAASVILYDEKSDELYFEVALGDSGDQARLKSEIRLKMGQGIAGSAAAARATLNISDASRDPRFFSEADSASSFQTRNLLAVPMIERGSLIGVLEVLNKVGADTFSPLDVHVMEMFSGIAAAAVANARLIEQQIKTERLTAIGQAIAGLTHHIKNIITGLNSSTELIDMSLDRGRRDVMDRTWPVLKRSVQRISNFVQDLLAFSKPRVPMRQECDLGALLCEARDAVRDLFNTKHIEMDMDLSGLNGAVWLEADGVYRCLLNLLNNAADALPATGGHVWVRAWSTAPDTLEMEVRDDGPGVPAELRDTIWDPFFSTKGARGTGLGLATTAKVIQEHNGTITLARSGSGACFHILLPGAMRPAVGARDELGESEQ